MPNVFRACRQLERFLGYNGISGPAHLEFEPRREYSDAELLEGAILIATIVYDRENHTTTIEYADGREPRKV